MIVQKEFLNKLRDFGLNSYESKLWTALLSRGISTAGELSDIANVPRSRSYDVLESLEKKGFIIMKIGKPIKYIAVPPSEVLDRVKLRVKEESERRAKLLDELQQTKIIEELTLLHNQGVELIEPTDFTGCFKGRNSIYNHIDSMIKNAEQSVTIVTTSDGVLRKFDYLRKSLAKAKDNNITIRIAAPIKKEHQSFIKEYVNFADIRHMDNIRARFVIVDNKEIMFMLLDDEKVHPTYDAGVWLKGNFLPTAVQQLFDAIWPSLKPVSKTK